jgi:aconitate hydratase
VATARGVPAGAGEEEIVVPHQSPNSFSAQDTLTVEPTGAAGTSETYRIHRISGVAGLENAAHLPYSLKVLLENLLRTEDGANVTTTQIEALGSWDPGAEPDTEIQFTPARVLMQDFTGVPCVVDLATMREAMADLGGDPTKINPLSPAELVIDHSVIADLFGRPDCLPSATSRSSTSATGERYQFLRWGQTAFDDFKVVPPGTGIVHQVNIEHLARVAFTARSTACCALPGHAGGHRLAHHDGQRAGRARLGVGGIEAEAADARPAGVDAHPARGRLQADRRDPRGGHRHRRRAHDHRHAAQARRGRQVRRVLRRGRGSRAAGQPRHDRQHEPRVRLDGGDLPDRRRDSATTCA